MKHHLIELRHLRSLVALEQTQSVSKAAALLCITQSALSHQLRQLEDLVNDPLFVRKTQPLRWTWVGERLLQLAQQTLNQLNDTARQIVQWQDGQSGQLRIALECHTCFDWLMPTMDRFRAHWPLIEQDIVSGFHADPIALLHDGRADVVLHSEQVDEPNVLVQPMFEYEIVAVLANDHPLTRKEYLVAQDFADDTLITYPVPEHMLDVMRQVLKPAGIQPNKRTSELTVAILQLVASKRGIAALPRWAVSDYVARGYVSILPITPTGLYATLFVACLNSFAKHAYLDDFMTLLRETCVQSLEGIRLFDLTSLA